MSTRNALLSLAACIVVSVAACALAKPNIILIMADDLGYGDLSCYGATMINTPNIDKLAEDGMRFDRYYTTGSVCIPTRYSVLSGRYPFRSDKVGSVKRLLIPPERTTTASVCKQAGYRTAAIGKWHLGYTMSSDIDWAGELKPGPLELGFDYHWGIPQNHNDLVRTYVHNRRIVGVDPNAEYREGSYGDKGSRELKRAAQGLLKERRDDKVNAVLAEKTMEFIRENKDQPFFVYFTPTIPHTHITPDVRFRGTSKAGQFGDFVQELDHHVGAIVGLVDELGLAERTLIVFTSDNGGQLRDHWTGGIGLNVADASGDVVKKARTAKIDAGKMGHRTNLHLREGKGSPYEGGFNVPCIMRWPGKVAAGSESSKLISAADYLATFAELLGVAVPAEHAEDSFSFADVLTGKAVEEPRSHVVLHRPGAHCFREGDWKLLDPSHDGGKRYKLELYNLREDPSETKNLAAVEPERVNAMRAKLKQIVKAGRSR